MRISDRSGTDFDGAKIKLTDQFDRIPIGRYFEPCEAISIVNECMKQYNFTIYSKVPAFLLVTDIAGLVQGASEGKVWLIC